MGITRKGLMLAPGIRDGALKITPFSNPNGETVFRVSGTIQGKRIRKNYATEEIALAAKHAFEREAMNLAPLPWTVAHPTPELVREAEKFGHLHNIITRLTGDQAIEAEGVFYRLKERNFSLSLSECVEHAFETYTPTKKAITIGDALKGFLDFKRKSAGEVKADAQYSSMRIVAEAIFTKAGRQTLSWSETIDFLSSLAKLSPSGARKRFEKMLGARVISKDIAGYYRLTQ